MTDQTTTEPTAAELRERKARLEERIGAAFGKMHEREAQLTREHALHIEEQGSLPDEAQTELDHLQRNWKALTVRNEQIDQEIEQADRRELLTGALKVRNELLIPHLAEANKHAAATKLALDELAVHVVAWREALRNASAHMPRRQGPNQLHIDSSWKERLGNQHGKHVLALALNARLGAFFEYEGVPLLGWRSDVDLESRDLAASMLVFYDAVHELAQFGLGGVPMEDGTLDPGVQRAGNTRMSGMGRSRQVTRAMTCGPDGLTPAERAAEGLE